MRELIWALVVTGVSTMAATMVASRSALPKTAAEVQYTPQVEGAVATPDPQAGVSQRLGRALISCREQRRDELCRHSEHECAVLRRHLNRLDLTDEETRRCQFDCVTGSLYAEAIDGLLLYLRTFPDRPTQIGVLRKELLACAQGEQLETFRRYGVKELQPIELPWLDLEMGSR